MFIAVLFITAAIGIFMVSSLLSLAVYVRRRSKYQPLDMSPERKFWYIFATRRDKK